MGFVPWIKYHTDLPEVSSGLHNEADNARKEKKKHRGLQMARTQQVVALLSNGYSVAKTLLDKNSPRLSDNETH